MNLYLVRHGESTGNVAGKIQGWKDFPLSNLGRDQAELVAEYFKELPLDYIYSSDLIRASETAEAIATRKNLSVHKWKEVREVHLGPFQGLSRQEIFEKYPDAASKTILTSGVEGTETIDELTKRCQYIVQQLQIAHKNNNVAIVSHGGFISIFLMYLIAGDQWHTLHRPFQIGNTSISHIEWPKNRRNPIFHYVNRTTHLVTEAKLNSNMRLL
ncbi:histidine phosphatase family protein [Halalkalibacter krulwichiae]|uniref:Phosphoserine phosphatase 1 n=1 Tax=Halalkalibacter krulwichiae TaxID=199441 RepID=A0A1X9M6B5_9BACI|nr:histidine phosphatase family protein [Halalkalibacter krulwichiae]ARK28998.1 Phosphoserine phosphatase 1 [Halalkalibacter krulwichiae]